jgi:hypothetical protein
MKKERHRYSRGKKKKKKKRKRKTNDRGVRESNRTKRRGRGEEGERKSLPLLPRKEPYRVGGKASLRRWKSLTQEEEQSWKKTSIKREKRAA